MDRSTFVMLPTTHPTNAAVPATPSRARWITAVALAYVVTALIGLQLAIASGNATAVWLPSGVALAAVLLRGPAIWPGIALGTLLATASTDAPVSTAAVIATGNTLAALAGGWLLARTDSPILDRGRSVLAFVLLGAIASTLVSATCGVAALALGGLEATVLVWWTWWLGDCIGVLVAAPVILAWAQPPDPTVQPPRSTTEGAALGLCVLVVSLAVFTRATPHYYLLFPPAIWAALRFGTRGASMVALVIFVVAAWRTAAGDGPFIADPLVPALLGSQTLVGVLSVTGLFLAAATTQRQRAEAQVRQSVDELQRSEDALRQLTRRQTTIREQERTRLGLDLHDNICQEIVGTGIVVASIRARLGAISPDVAESFDRVQRYVNELVEHLRQLAHELQPLQLRELGLKESLQSLARGLTSDACRVTVTVETMLRRLDETYEIAVYRIAQEALANAVRHAKASAIELRLCIDGRGLHLEVEDDGRGFTTTIHLKSLGLSSMRERAIALGGHLDVRSTPGAGTTIRLELPHPRYASRSAA